MTVSSGNTKFSLLPRGTQPVPAPGAPRQLQRHRRHPPAERRCLSRSTIHSRASAPQILLEPLQRCRGAARSASCVHHFLSAAFTLPHSRGALSQLVSRYAGWELSTQGPSNSSIPCLERKLGLQEQFRHP